MIYLAAGFFVATILMLTFAFGGGISAPIQEAAEYAAVFFALATVVAVVSAVFERPKL